MIVPLLALTIASSVPQYEQLTGDVVSVRSFLRDGRVVSEATVRASDGSSRLVRLLGGSVDGVAARVPGLPDLAVGERAVLWLEDGWLRAKADAGTRRHFVQARATRSGARLRWFDSSCVDIVVDARGSDDIPDDSDTAAAERAAANWRAAAACGYLDLRVTESPAPLPQPLPRFDKRDPGSWKNVVTWIEDVWPAGYPAGAAALTTLQFVDDAGSCDDGQILQADVELNGVDFTFYTDASCHGGDGADVENALTHEFGHLVGLDHTCDDGARTPTPIDDRGNPIPSCFGPLPDGIVDSTMYNLAEPCETKKRSPEADDVAGFCAIYPRAVDPGRCARPEIAECSGCAIGGGGGSTAFAFVALLGWRARYKGG